MSLRWLQTDDVVEGFRPQTLRSRLRLQRPTTRFCRGRLQTANASVSSEASEHDRCGISSALSADLQESQSRHEDEAITILITAYKVIRIVATFGTIGGTEIDCLDGQERLLRWTAMYRATVLQSNVDVGHFPHDLHHVQLKLAILSHRSKNRT
ncbi:hypothetical protein IV203_024915 [Nitzschia inconspicua]|uniref:Uncharacterized protein n=1 Tax=Nitzschia inconspicua TaxID=303405 RepID=A0A9K3PAH8_9STRA|nr:hypothetical protein IV203_024915 [Nitzschia inconspicua]